MCREHALFPVVVGPIVDEDEFQITITLPDLFNPLKRREVRLSKAHVKIVERFELEAQK